MPPAHTGSAFRQFVTIAGVLGATAGIAALRRAIPLFAGIGIAGAVVFGRNGMHPADLVGPASGSIAGRAALAGVWLLVSVPIVRVLLETRTTFFLRSLPVPHWQFWLAHALYLLPVQVPWIALWLGARGAFATVSATVPIVALQLAIVARPGGWRSGLALLLVATMVSGAPATLRLAAGTVALPVMLVEAWLRAPERGDSRQKNWVATRSATIALTITYLARLRRMEMPALIRGTLAVVTGGLAFMLAARNNALTDPRTLSTLSLGIATLPLAVACGSISGPVIETERTLRWLLDATATGNPVRVTAGAGVCATLGAVFGAVHGGIAAATTAASTGVRLRLATLAIGWGAVLGLYANFSARRAETRDGVDGSSVVVRMTLGAIAGIAALLLAREWVVLSIALVMVALVASTGAQPRFQRRRM